jgi:copper(I)-binding protein
MNRLRSRFALVLALLALLAIPLAVACGGDDDDDDDDQTGEPTATQEAEGVTLGDLTITGGWVRTTTNDVSAAYLMVQNAGLEDTLVAAASPISPMVQLHEVITEGGSSKMQQKEGGFPVPAQGMVELKPGGYHIMLMDLTEPLEEGDMVEVTVTFEKAGEVTLTLPVQKAEGTSMDMGGMDGGMGAETPTMGN